jgi:hypothetical protein
MEGKSVGFRSLSPFLIYLIYELKDKKSIPVIKFKELID